MEKAIISIQWVKGLYMHVQLTSETRDLILLFKLPFFLNDHIRFLSVAGQTCMCLGPLDAFRWNWYQKIMLKCSNRKFNHHGL